ncbi:transmembrane protein 232 isoform X3 [Nematostella vectensis]|uniref:transmembrane protein 232 isoform X3 n=1 Tax=Nematostella vectensis TaxID=45351 RepID=UPI0020770BE2|nr:transmembrane protein 232 isoform X3 [Nematostella vectensis]
MPIDKVPVVHKFGIISHSQRVSLEQRLEQKATVGNVPNTYARTKLLSEVSDDFVAKFNDSNYDDQQTLLPTASKMLMRAKRRVGLSGRGEGNHVNIPKAWAELTLLAQINNRGIQEESLEVLIASVTQAPLSTSHIPSLFYLAKSVLHWLRKSGLNQPFLRTGELKLLKMGHLVFIRLYHAHQTNNLQGHEEDRVSLKQYLEGVSEQQYIYKSFPGALLALRFITEVGYLICKGVKLPPDYPTRQEKNQGGTSTGAASPAQSLGAKTNPHSLHMEKILEEEFNEYSNPPSQQRGSSVLECPREMSVTLWHVLDVWRSLTHRGTGLNQAIRGLSICATGLANESWLDVSCAFLILAHASSNDLTILQTFQALASGVLARPAEISEVHALHIHHMCENCLSSFTGHQASHEVGGEGGELDEFFSVGQTPSIVRGLRDFASLSFLDKEGRHSRADTDDTDSLRSNDQKSNASSDASLADVSSVESVRTGTRKKSSERLRKERRTQSNLSKNAPQGSHTLGDESSSDDDEKERTVKPRSGKHSGSVRFQTAEQVNTAPGTSSGSSFPEGLERETTKGSLYSAQTRGSSVTVPDQGDQAEEVAESDVTTTQKTATTLLPDYTGLLGWPWELAYLYVETMTSVALNGCSSHIQKVALLGSEAYRKPEVFRKSDGGVRSGMGLIDLLKFEFPRDASGEPVRDWSWRVRFAAVHGLVRVCRHCHGNSVKDGLRSVAWNSLMKHHSAERDPRVLEALKLAQVEVDLDTKVQSEASMRSLPTHIAESLTALMLPPLPPVVPEPEVTTRSRSRANRVAKPQVVSKGQTRPSLRQEILLATAAAEPPVDYSTRLNTDLMSVIHKQWRKQLHEEEQEAEADRRRQEGRRVLATQGSGTATPLRSTATPPAYEGSGASLKIHSLVSSPATPITDVGIDWAGSRVCGTPGGEGSQACDSTSSRTGSSDNKEEPKIEMNTRTQARYVKFAEPPDTA